MCLRIYVWKYNTSLFEWNFVRMNGTFEPAKDSSETMLCHYMNVGDSCPAYLRMHCMKNQSQVVICLPNHSKRGIFYIRSYVHGFVGIISYNLRYEWTFFYVDKVKTLSPHTKRIQNETTKCR